MLSRSLMIPSRSLPYCIMPTHLFKKYNVDFSQATSCTPFHALNSSLLKRMQVGTIRASQVPSHPTPPPQFQPGFSSSSDPYSNLTNQMNSLTLGQSNTTTLLEQLLTN